MEYRYYDTIDSTNNEVKRILAAENLSSPLLVVAGTQTAGRGRQGKSFFSPADTGLYMTIAVPMNFPIASQVTITTRVAVAVAEAIEREFADYKIVPEIKWVNDIYIHGRKISGILCEAINDYVEGLLRWAVIGVGVNISTRDWPEELSGIAGSIAGETAGAAYEPLAGKKPDSSEPGSLALSICGRILDLLDDFTDVSYLNYYKAHSNVIGKDITFTENNKTRLAHAIDIHEDGGLIVRLIDGDDAGETKVLNSGEISVRVDK